MDHHNGENKGMTDDYLKALAKIYKSTNDEMKKQGLIMDYKILIGNDATPQDFDILLMVEFKNMAAFDGLREKADPIADKILGSEDARGRVRSNGWRFGRLWETS